MRPDRAPAATVEERVLAQVRAAGSRELPTHEQLVDLVRQADPLLGRPAITAAVSQVRAHVSGLGPLDALLADPAVSDVLVNGPGPVWVERAGRVGPTAVVVDRATIDGLVERIVGPLGRRIDPASPVVDARLPDGSRVHVMVPPLAVDGPYVTIRRFAARAITVEDAAGAPVAALLREAVTARANLLVVGGTGSGKTTLLNALASSVAAGERIITVEDAAELRLASDHVVRLETRPASVEGVGAVSCRELVRNALRMRPDRLVVGEVRGPEALDMVQAMNTGHDGSLSTLHANSCEDALRRLEILVLLAGIGLPHAAVRDQIAAAVDLLVHVARRADGGRRVVEVAEVPVPDADPGNERARRGIRLLAVGDRVVARPRRWAGGAPGTPRHPPATPGGEP